jgi:DNA-binding response OmpR family regulator
MKDKRKLPVTILVCDADPDERLWDLGARASEGAGALQELRATAGFADIPVVSMSASRDEDEVARGYHLGVNAFLAKPVTFGRLVDVMNALGRYWLEFVEQPPVPA